MNTTGVLVLLGTALVTSACGGADGQGDPPAPITVAGTVTLNRGFSEVNVTEGDCVGALGFDDVRPGANVTVLDASSKKLATGALSAGKRVSDHECQFTFKLGDVPGGEKVYSLRVGSRKDYDFPPAKATSLALRLDYRL